MKLYSFDEFVNEMVYCTFSSDKDFDYMISFLNKLVFSFVGLRWLAIKADKETQEYNYSFYREYYEKHKKHFDAASFYGFKYEHVQTQKGDKFVIDIDANHSFVIYPMADENESVNKKNYNADLNIIENPYNPRGVMYAVANGKAKRLDVDFNFTYVCDTFLASRYFSHKNEAYNDIKNVLDAVEKCAEEWGIRSRYAKKNEEVKKMYNDFKTDYQERIDRVNKIHGIKQGGMTLHVFVDDVEVESEHLACNEDLIGTLEDVKFLYVLNAKYEIQDAIEKGEHPDTSNMTNLENAVRRRKVYTARNLPIDHYTLKDYYRTYSNETCEHCGKYPIRNIMVIQNPKGETFHVGNECVEHLVDIPEEEFEANWNAPFKEAIKIMTKVNGDKKKGRNGIWYLHDDEMIYISTVGDLLDSPFFKVNFNRFGEYHVFNYTYKINKNDYAIRSVSVDFAKKMLPRYYAESIVINADIHGIYKSIMHGFDYKYTFAKFEYDGFMYDFNSYMDGATGFLKKTDASMGIYKQEILDDGYGMKKFRYSFGRVTFEYRYTKIEEQ